MIDLLITVLFYAGCGVVAYIASYYISFYVALALFKLLIPIKNKHGDSPALILLAPFFWLGFSLDIYWNIVHFSPKLYLMNRNDGINNMRFWPNFGLVTSIDTLYKITLTERLQFILDTYPTYSNAYRYAVEIGVMLNEYDPDHLTYGDTRTF